MKNAEWYDSMVKKVVRLQEIEKEFGREKMGPAMCLELELLMNDLQKFEDERDLEMIRELEEREAIADRLLEMEAWTR